jgi:methionyl-tRNA formyltransferase
MRNVPRGNLRNRTMPPPMRVVFFGTPQFAVPTLERLLDSEHQVVAVVSQPDRPAGRGLKMHAPPVKELALARGIPVHQPASVRKPEFEAWLRGQRADVAVVVAYGKILPQNVLDAVPHGFLNVHASLLPAYRGAAPIQWAIVRGETKTGISIMKLDAGMDTGDVVSMAEVPILEDDDANSLSDMLSVVGAHEMLKVLDRLARDGRLDATPQDHSRASIAPLIERQHARIDWNRSADEVICLVRGFVAWPKAYTSLGGKDLKVTKVEPCASEWLASERFGGADVPNGTVVDTIRGAGPVVKCGKGFVILARVQPEAKPEMGGMDAVNGGLLRIGTRLGA